MLKDKDLSNGGSIELRTSAERKAEEARLLAAQAAEKNKKK